MKIAFCGNFGTHNFGNECTLAAILCNLRRRVPDAEFLAISVVPEDTAGRHGVKAIPMWSAPSGNSASPLMRAIRRIVKPFAEWGHALRQSRGLSALIVPGTGILNDIHQGSFGFPYNLFKWAMATRLQGGQVFFVSIGVETITRPLPRFFIRCVLSLAARRSFRDPRALKLVRSIGFQGASDLFPDLAFSLPEYIPSTCPYPSRVRTVAVGLFDYRDPARNGRVAQAYENYVDGMSSLVLWLIEHGYAVRLIIGDLSLDMAVRNDVRARLQARGFDLAHPDYTDEPATSYEQIMDQLAPVDLVIASRFHNIVSAMFLGRPVLALSYEGKIDLLMQDMGLGEYCQPLAAFDPERLIAQFLQLEREAPQLRDQIADKVRVNREKLERQYDLLIADLGVSSGPKSEGAHPDRALKASGG